MEQLPLRTAAVDRNFGERLAAVDQIRPEQRSLRVGWLFVAGRTSGPDGRPRRVFHPLVALSVRVDRRPGFGGARLVPAGDVEITELVTDRDQRYRLESEVQYGGGALEGLSGEAIPTALLGRLDGLRRFARAVASAAGLPAGRLVPVKEGPEQLVRGDDLVIVAGVGVYAAHETGTVSRSGSLRAWAAAPLDRWTAFHSLYLDAPPPNGGRDGGSRAVESPYLLTPVQEQAVVRSRRDSVTLISGAPGTGKSHTVVAIACDALARGESVLVAAKSDATVDALLDLLERAPGPDPVVFGSSERREALAARLAAGQLQPLSDDRLATARHERARARSAEASLTSAIVDRLRAETLVAFGDDSEDEARRCAPGLFDPSVDHAEAAWLVAEVLSPPGGWWARRRRRRRLRALRLLAGCDDRAPIADVERALEVARAARVAANLLDEGGLELSAAWDELRRLADQARHVTARWLAAQSRSDARLNRSTLPAVAALATALRSGRAARRDQLGRLDDDGLTRALPLWVGSLPDIDDLLPPIAGFFDVVILDEASSIDQALAVPALLRARRGVIVGDPHQLRHVSFLSDRRLQDVLDAHGVSAHPLLAARLDVRRNSAFDVAAGVAPVLTLDEHFRSDPHLVDFVADRIYGGALHVATRAPSTASRDCVKVVRTAGYRDRNGVVAAEVEWVVRELERLRGLGARSVGVITPFRAQADALEAAVLGRFCTDDLETLDLRVGTVHAFQGNERDMVVASLGLGPDQDSTSWRFVEDPHLFTVLVTRARRHFTVLVSGDPPAGGLVSAYLAQADTPPGPPPSGPPASRWVEDVAMAFAAVGSPSSRRTHAGGTSLTSASSAPEISPSKRPSTRMGLRRTSPAISLSCAPGGRCLRRSPLAGPSVGASWSSTCWRESARPARLHRKTARRTSRLELP
ncbi:MAG: ATP-binding protein [Actinomycetota bacterium]|nr:ATP-binding protein [Actinomycetota bacterium]